MNLSLSFISFLTGGLFFAFSSHSASSGPGAEEKPTAPLARVTYHRIPDTRFPFLTQVPGAPSEKPRLVINPKYLEPAERALLLSSHKFQLCSHMVEWFLNPKVGAFLSAEDDIKPMEKFFIDLENNLGTLLDPLPSQASERAPLPIETMKALRQRQPMAWAVAKANDINLSLLKVLDLLGPPDHLLAKEDLSSQISRQMDQLTKALIFLAKKIEKTNKIVIFEVLKRHLSNEMSQFKMLDAKGQEEIKTLLKKTIETSTLSPFLEKIKKENELLLKVARSLEALLVTIPGLAHPFHLPAEAPLPQDVSNPVVAQTLQVLETGWIQCSDFTQKMGVLLAHMDALKPVLLDPKIQQALDAFTKDYQEFSGPRKPKAQPTSSEIKQKKASDRPF